MLVTVYTRADKASKPQAERTYLEGLEWPNLQMNGTYVTVDRQLGMTVRVRVLADHV